MTIRLISDTRTSCSAEARTRLAGLLLLVSALAGSAMSAPSAVPGTNGLVVAETGRGFVLLNATTNSLVARVPGTGRFDHAPAFSPDGRRIVDTTGGSVRRLPAGSP